MEASTILRRCRLRSGASLRALARRAGTSHSALAAYEAGRKSPNAQTFERILEAAGFVVEVRRAPSAVITDLDRRGDDLEEVLALAELFPTRHDQVLHAPVFGRS